MLVESRLGSEFSKLTNAPWSMEPTRLPLVGGSIASHSSMQLSPTGKKLNNLTEHFLTPTVKFLISVEVKHTLQV